MTLLREAVYGSVNYEIAQRMGVKGDVESLDPKVGIRELSWQAHNAVLSLACAIQIEKPLFSLEGGLTFDFSEQTESGTQQVGSLSVHAQRINGQTSFYTYDFVGQNGNSFFAFHRYSNGFLEDIHVPESPTTVNQNSDALPFPVQIAYRLKGIMNLLKNVQSIPRGSTPRLSAEYSPEGLVPDTISKYYITGIHSPDREIDIPLNLPVVNRIETIGAEVDIVKTEL
jgi:hypothetical protein